MTAQTTTGNEALDQVVARSHWLLRIAWAAVFLHMGVSKFLGAGIGGFAEMMGLPFAVAVLVALGELAAGVLVLAGAWLGNGLGGWATRLGALAGIPILVGAIVMVHWGQWHFAASESHPMGGMAFQVTLLLLGIYMLVRGNRL